MDVIDITLDIFPNPVGHRFPELVRSIGSAGQRSLLLGKFPRRRFQHRQITEILVSPSAAGIRYLLHGREATAFANPRSMVDGLLCSMLLNGSG